MWFDVFLSSGGPETDSAEVDLFILEAELPNRTSPGWRGEAGVGTSEGRTASFKDSSFRGVLQSCGWRRGRVLLDDFPERDGTPALTGCLNGQ